MEAGPVLRSSPSPVRQAGHGQRYWSRDRKLERGEERREGKGCDVKCVTRPS
jgi:hypothetical protein